MTGVGHSRWRLPVSEIFTVKETASSGRAIVAQMDTQPGCHLLTTHSKHSPIAHVILRPYRREVCAWCFLYDRGRQWKIRDIAEGMAFCSIECQTHWHANNDAFCREAFRAIETSIKGQATRQNHGAIEESTYGGSALVEGSASPDSVDEAWAMVKEQGTAVVRARTATKPSKAQRAIVRHATNLISDPDILSYVLSGVLTTYRSWVSHNDGNGGVPSTDAEDLLPSLFELVPDEKVFVENPMTPSPLHAYTSTYLLLLALLPATLLPLIAPKLVINLASRAAHNAFSIRPEGTTDGFQSGEFLGWGVWPEASFFNHSCRPNVRKDRIGRLWSFTVDIDAGKTVQQGQQLCITYLGGDERDLDVAERRKRLQEQWGFRCLCDRCLEESGES